MINYIIIGAGWRAEFYLRIAKLMPEKFNAVAICVRNPERAEYISSKYNVKVLNTVEEVLKENFDFIVNCICKKDISAFSETLSDMGYYVLAETPVTKMPSGNHDYSKIQIAEQFHLKGTYKAIKKIINSGILGDVVHINLSVAHDYHAMSLARFFLDDYEKPEFIAGYDFDDAMLKTNARSGELNDKKVVNVVQKVRMYKFKNATVIFDHNKEQYFAPIRKNRILIRGTRGEIENNEVRYFNKNNEFVVSEIKHLTSGLLDGFYPDRIVFEDMVLHKYKLCEARLSEEEEAVAECLMKMNEYVNGKAELYTPQKAWEDFDF